MIVRNDRYTVQNLSVNSFNQIFVYKKIDVLHCLLYKVNFEQITWFLRLYTTMKAFVILCVLLIGVAMAIPTETTDNDFFVIRDQYVQPDINCTSNADCGNGNCISGTCVCSSGYITFPSDSTTACNYVQKYQLTAFLLHFFLGAFGAGEFYLGNNAYGAGQIVLNFCSLIIGCVVGCCMLKGGKTGGALACMGSCLIVLAAIGCFVWWIIDCVFIGTFHYSVDGSGAPIAHW